MVGQSRKKFNFVKSMKRKGECAWIMQLPNIRFLH